MNMATRWRLVLAMLVASTSAPAADLDMYGSPLPEGAVARFGTVRGRHAEPIVAVGYSRDGNLLFSLDGSIVKVWEFKPDSIAQSGWKPDNIAQSLTLRLEISDGRGSAQCAAFLPDGKTLAVGGAGQIRYHDVRTGKLRRRDRLGQAEVRSLAVSPDGSALAAGCSDDSIRLIEAGTGRLLHKLPHSMNTEGSVADSLVPAAFSPDGKLLAAGEFEKVRLWDAAGKEVSRIPMEKNIALAVHFAPDGKTLAIGCLDRSIILWNIEANQELRRLRGHEGPVIAVAISPDGKTLVSGSSCDPMSKECTLRLWDLAAGKERRRRLGLGNAVLSPAFTPDSKTLAWCDGGNAVRFSDAAGESDPAALPGHAGYVMSLWFTPDGKRLLSSATDHTFRAWESPSGKQLAVRPASGNSVDGFDHVALSRDGRTLASAGSGNSVRVWNATELKERFRLQAASEVWSLALSPDGKLLATGGVSTTVQLWDLTTRKEITRFGNLDEKVFALASSPDGSKIAAGTWGDEGSIYIWDVAKREALHRLRGHSVRHLSFSADGKWLGSCGLRGRVFIWDADKGEIRHRLEVNGTHAYGAVFSPDSRWLAAAGSDDIRLWSVADGKCLRAFKGERDVQALAFSPDGRFLAAGGADTSTLLWRLKP